MWSDGYFARIYFLKVRKTTLRANPETNVNKFMCVHICNPPILHKTYMQYVHYKVNP